MSAQKVLHLVEVVRYRPQGKVGKKELIPKPGVLEVCTDLDEAIRCAASWVNERPRLGFKLRHFAAERPYWRCQRLGLEVVVHDYGLNERRPEEPCGKTLRETARSQEVHGAPCVLPKGHDGPRCSPFRCEWRNKAGARCRRMAGHNRKKRERRHLTLRPKEHTGDRDLDELLDDLDKD